MGVLSPNKSQLVYLRLMQLTHYTKQSVYVAYPEWSPHGNQVVYEYFESTGNIWLLELK
jgi:hypothetical protein